MLWPGPSFHKIAKPFPTSSSFFYTWFDFYPFLPVLCFWNSACIPNSFSSPREMFSFFPPLPSYWPSFLPSFLPGWGLKKKWKTFEGGWGGPLIAKADAPLNPKTKKVPDILQHQRAAACRPGWGSSAPHIPPNTSPPASWSIYHHHVNCVALAQAASHFYFLFFIISRVQSICHDLTHTSNLNTGDPHSQILYTTVSLITSWLYKLIIMLKVW